MSKRTGLQAHLFALGVEDRVHAQRHLATAAQQAQQRPLGGHGGPGFGVVNGGESAQGFGGIGAALQPDGPLADGGHHLAGAEDFHGEPGVPGFQHAGAEGVGVAEAFQSGTGEDEPRPVRVFGQLAQARADVAANLAHPQVGPTPLELTLPTQAARRQGRAGRQQVEPGKTAP